MDAHRLAEIRARMEALEDAKRGNWALTARPEQVPPADYSLWLVVSGRGWGKRDRPPRKCVGWPRLRTSTSRLWRRNTST